MEKIVQVIQLSGDYSSGDYEALHEIWIANYKESVLHVDELETIPWLYLPSPGWGEAIAQLMDSETFG